MNAWPRSAALGLSVLAAAAASPSLIASAPFEGSIPLSLPGGTLKVAVEPEAWPGVARAARDLSADLSAVTGREIEISHQGPADVVVLAATLGRSPALDDLASRGLVDVEGLRGQWESFVIQTVEKPWPGVERAVVVAGSDKRGAIYGLYEISRQAGVSPWTWWADVPVRKSAELHIRSGRLHEPSPKVKYRGIFLNDEAPALSGWVHEKFGGYNHKFYERVFNLLLRLRANALWPAMWNNAFYLDDPLNGILADEYGIVMGTSHVEPMNRADKEWNWLKYPATWWNYETHPRELEGFWRDGLLRSRRYETLTTIAMRGKIDTPMSEEANIALLERIVAAQRRIIGEIVNPQVEEVPQVWALYKEVQEYYEKGMRVPDDVTLLWADDNWGNIRRLPTPEERGRKGGAGIYYHFDYVGDPRNHKWLNTTQIERVWEQMTLAHQTGANRLWIVNVGDLKPMEYPISFFMDLAWDPDALPIQKVDQWSRAWCAEQLGPEFASEASRLIEGYTKLNHRRKPELLDQDTFSLVHHQEFERVVQEWTDLRDAALALEARMPSGRQSAYYQLVLHPILACANLNELYLAVARSRRAAVEGRASAARYADAAERHFRIDQDLEDRYHALEGGRWNHFMSQTRIGYTSWQQPERNLMPSLGRPNVPDEARLGAAIEGMPGTASGRARLPLFTRAGQAAWIDLFNQGTERLTFRAKAPEGFLLSLSEGEVGDEIRLMVEWTGESGSGEIEITASDGSRLMVEAPVRRPTGAERGAVEQDGWAVIEAPRPDRIGGEGWTRLPSLGKTEGGLTSMPPTRPRMMPAEGAPWTEYEFTTFTEAAPKITAILAPTQKLWTLDGLLFAAAIDGGDPQIVNIHEDYVYFTPSWEKSVAEASIKRTLDFPALRPGVHTLKIWSLDPAIVFHRFLIDLGGLKPSYLGPPSRH